MDTAHLLRGRPETGRDNLMPTQEYDCPEHGKFPVSVPHGDDVPKRALCPVSTGLMPVDENPDHDVPGPCGRFSPWGPPIGNPCEACGGSGAKPGTPPNDCDFIECPYCQGTGVW